MSSEWDSSPDGIAWEAVQRIWDDVHTWTHAIPSLDELPNEVAIQGKCILFYGRNSYSKPEHEHYWSPILENPTYKDVLDHFDDAIVSVGDYHHVFMEGVRLTKMQHDPFEYDENGDLAGIPIYEFCAGS